MILAKLALLTLFAVPVAIDRTEPVPDPAAEFGRLTFPDQRVLIRALVTSANECIARTVSADPRFPLAASAEVNELIVESVPSCLEPVRTMIEGYDRAFGAGAGEVFFTGPYLDALPDAVHRLMGSTRR